MSAPPQLQGSKGLKNLNRHFGHHTFSGSSVFCPQAERLRSNWYSTAADVAGMTQVLVGGAPGKKAGGEEAGNVSAYEQDGGSVLKEQTAGAWAAPF